MFVRLSLVIYLESENRQERLGQRETEDPSQDLGDRTQPGTGAGLKATNGEITT